MQKSFHHLLFFFFIICISISSATPDYLQNPDFEIPPTNLTANATSQRWLLSGANTVPGWSYNGTVWYVEWGGGHALQLGTDGKINQTVKAKGGDDVLHYVLGFTVAAQNEDCANNRTAVNVTLREDSYRDVWRVIYLQQNSSRNLWERHALFLGQLGGGEYVHIEVESLATTSCWPILDSFTVNRNPLPIWYNGNMLANGGFEVGPALMKNSPGGIILNEEQEVFESPLQEWEIVGTLRYIDSSHYKVPRGNAAVELLSVSGDPSGVAKDFAIPLPPSTYMLNFTLGDANDSCVGDLIVYVELGLIVHNFTVQSSGTGSAFKHSFTFKVEKSTPITSLTFYSLNETRTRDGLLCGPVLDGIFLVDMLLNVSDGERKQVCNGVVLVLSYFLAFVMIILH